ncbi:MAG: hypothetical protein ABSB73_11570, partial [Solirubrobacteraceae bacterium]
MAFAPATVLTNVERAIVADRFGPATTYTNAPNYIQVGTGATAAARTAAATDTALSSPIGSRTAGSQTDVTTTLTGDTSQIVATVTMTAPAAVDEGGLFDAASGGHMVVS